MMNFSRIWKGVIPPYFTVNNSVVLSGDLLYLCLKNQDNDRELLLYDLKNLEILSSEKVYWTTILDVLDGNVYLAKIEDARSHLQVSRIGCYNYLMRTNVPIWKGALLYEKYRFTPQRIKKHTLKVGRYHFNLHGPTLQLKEFSSNNDMVNDLENGDCIIIDSSGVTYVEAGNIIKWKNTDLKSWWYQFSTYDKMFFLKPGNLLCTLEIITGCYKEELINFPIEVKRITGDWVHVNDRNFDFTSIYDGFIYNDQLFAIDPNSNKVISTKGFEWKIPVANNEDYYIIAANSSYVVLLGADDEVYGEIFVMSTEDKK